MRARVRVRQGSTSRFAPVCEYPEYRLREYPRVPCVSTPEYPCVSTPEYHLCEYPRYHLREYPRVPLREFCLDGPRGPPMVGRSWTAAGASELPLRGTR